MLRSQLRKITPAFLLEARRRRIREQERKRNAGKSTKEIFESIYRDGKWGGEAPEEGSGSGSDILVAMSYVDLVNAFLRNHPEINTIVDIGCGDFRVGQHFELGEGQTYLGTDIVEPLVEQLSQRYGSDQVSFMQLDAIEDQLPKADLYLVRQVLQHLSNEQAIRIIEKVSVNGRFSLITDHHPDAKNLMRRNLDKPTGPDIRVYDGSGLYFDYPPFNIPDAKIVLETGVSVGIVSPDEKLVTYLVPGKRG